MKNILHKDVNGHTNGTLIFDSTSKDHEGQYLCEIDNGDGEALRKTVSLTVHGRIFFTNSIKLFFL